MKKVIFLSVALFMFMGSFHAIAQTTKKQSDKMPATPKVEVYYFHYSTRCATCHAVEDNSKKALEALYPEKVKSGTYSFKAVNLDDDSSKALAKRLNVGGQSLLVVCADKKVDLTSKVFLYAQDLNKIKMEIKKTVDKIILR